MKTNCFGIFKNKIENYDHSTKTDRVIKTYYFFSLIGIIISFVRMPIFLVLNQNILLIWSLFSLGFYIASPRIIKNKKLSTFILISHIEVTIYVALTIMLLGWNFNTHFAILVLLASSYSSPFKSERLRDLIPLFEFIILTILFIFYYNKKDISASYDINSLRYIIYHLSAYLNLFFSMLIVFVTIKVSRISEVSRKVEMQVKNQDLEKQVMYDTLTGLLTRNAFLEELKKAEQEFKSDNQNFVIVFGDIDNFKNINDTYGHDFGDTVLETVANSIRNSLRQEDHVSRWGGEEFLFLLNKLSLNEAVVRADRVRKTIEALEISHRDEKIPITITFGLAESTRNMDLEELINKADEMMYEGKFKGKNRVNF